MKYQRLPFFRSAGPTAAASIALEHVARKQTRLAFGPVMFVSCVPIATKSVPFSSAIAETARPTADERQPESTSTFSCEIKRFASLEPTAGWFASSPRTIVNCTREFFRFQLSTAACKPVCCDSDAAA